MTDLYNRRHYDEVRAKIEKSGKTEGLTIISVDVNHLKVVNDKIGHVAGDEIVVATAQCLKKSFEGAEAICRTGGDEFMVVSRCPDSEIEAQLRRLEEAVAAWKGEYVERFSVSVGVASHGEFPDYSFGELEKKADRRMYVQKVNAHEE